MTFSLISVDRERCCVCVAGVNFNCNSSPNPLSSYIPSNLFSPSFLIFLVLRTSLQCIHTHKQHALHYITITFHYKTRIQSKSYKEQQTHAEATGTRTASGQVCCQLQHGASSAANGSCMATAVLQCEGSVVNKLH